MTVLSYHTRSLVASWLMDGSGQPHALATGKSRVNCELGIRPISRPSQESLETPIDGPCEVLERFGRPRSVRVPYPAAAGKWPLP